MDRFQDIVIERTKRFLREKEFEEAILFGSVARGEYDEESDVDLIIISEKFRQIPKFKRHVGLFRDLQLGRTVEFNCYTKEEFAESVKLAGRMKTALAEGIEIFP